MRDPERIAQRRGWLIALARYVAVGGIGLLSWNLMARSRGSCFRSTQLCHDCGLLAQCRLPRAQNASAAAKTSATTEVEPRARAASSANPASDTATPDASAFGSRLETTSEHTAAR